MTECVMHLAVTLVLSCLIDSVGSASVSLSEVGSCGIGFLVSWCVTRGSLESLACLSVTLSFSYYTMFESIARTIPILGLSVADRWHSRTVTTTLRRARR